MLKPVTNDAAVANTAFRCQGLNGAFKTIECMGLAFLDDLETFVIVVAASNAFSHSIISLIY